VPATGAATLGANGTVDLLDPRFDVQTVDQDAEMQAALLARPGRRRWLGVRIGHRQAGDDDPVGQRAFDMGGPAQQAQRRPVEREVVNRQPGTLAVVDVDARRGQRVGKAAAKPVQLHQAAGQRGRLPFDQAPAWAGIGTDQHHRQHQQDQRDREADQQPGDPAEDAPGRARRAAGRRDVGHQNASPRPI
jgi:hypothetical protein